jgi:hypothetical protein
MDKKQFEQETVYCEQLQCCTLYFFSRSFYKPHLALHPMRHFAYNSLEECLLRATRQSCSSCRRDTGLYRCLLRAATVLHTLIPLSKLLQALPSSVSASSCLPLLLLQRGLRGYRLLASSITTKIIHSIASSYSTALYCVRYFAYNCLQDCLLRVTRQSCSSCGRDTGLYHCPLRARYRRRDRSAPQS